jgi:high affinity sulfate transporter 1
VKVSRAGPGGLQRFLPGLAALRNYNPAWFRYDIVAGVSVAAVAVPIAIAYAQLAGVPPVYGLYASILPLVAYALWGSSRQLIVAPDAATCAIVATIVFPLAGPDPARYLALTAALAMMTGLFCLAAGALRLGFLTNFLARPILTGYLNGIAISVISGQLGKLFGFPLKPAGFFRLLREFLSRLKETHLLTLALGLGCLVLLRILKRVAPKLPAPLVVVALGILASELFHLRAQGVALLGAIPAGLPALRLPAVSLSDLGSLAFGGMGLALISFTSAMVTARGFAVKNRYDIDSNQEFVALGVADLGAGLLQGFAVSGADSRTAVNDSVGGKSQVTGLIAAGLFVLTLLFLTTPLASLPITVLSAVLISSAIGLFDLRALVGLRRISPQEFRLSLLTLLGVITVGVLPGVLVAVGLALIQLLANASRPHDAVVGRVPGTGVYHDIAGHPEAETFPGLVIYRFDAPLLFFNSDRFKSRVRSVIHEAGTKPRCLILDAETMSGMDTTGAAGLGEVCDELDDEGVTLAVAGAKGPIRSMLARTGLTQRIGSERLFPTLESAVEAMTQIRNGFPTKT